MADEWGPWIRHDGDPQSFLDSQPRGDSRVYLRALGGGVLPPSGGEVTHLWPGLNWVKRRKYIIAGPVVRRCKDPDYAPITAYRFSRPKGLQQLLDIAADLPRELIREDA